MRETIVKLSVLSSVCHLLTFILVALAGIYSIKWLGFGALLTLMVGLFFNKQINDEVEFNTIEPEEPQDEDPYISSIIKKDQQ